ncbi:NUDIX domain-containing protein [Candidatus Kaiserbacteria bacterium]|nr:NUDIX domain-containing protein [Candidatus Kaiserbacteria bacterium]USN91969.1 MAG: NUDIX domain-containing protein [Candidatus Nomurabacteria bacterium]
MKILAEISEKSLGLTGDCERLGSDYELRKSARVILLNKKGEMAVQYLSNYGFHKLPGGGVDAGETIEEALKREALEEVGCDCEIVREVGMTIEYRNKYQLLHISYCFVANMVGEVGQTKLEEGEIEEGQETLWMPPAIAFEKMKKDKPGKFEGHFILERETSFLDEYLKNNNSKQKHEQIQYIEFLSNDIERIKKFYSGCFGWEFTDYGKEYSAFSGEYVDGGFGVGEPVKGSVLTVLYSEDLETTKEKVKKAGGVITKETFSFPGGRRFEFEDIDGNKLAVWSDR